MLYGTQETPDCRTCAPLYPKTGFCGRNRQAPPDAEISYIVYIQVFNPKTGEQISTYLVAVSYEGKITSKYYPNPSKVVGVPTSNFPIPSAICPCFRHTASMSALR
jgi:hypothetical protein